MGRLSGKRSVEVNAARERCYAVAADIEQSPEWQGSLRRVEVLERDAEGRPALVQTESDAKVKTITSRLRFSFEPPSRIRWVQEEGDTRSLDGSWVFEELGDGRTRATYALAVDPGRVLGMLLRGPAEGKVREYLLGDAAEGLKGRAEDAS
jgi:uncharacterized membrane protein